MAEATMLMASDSGLKKRIALDDTRFRAPDELVWAAARSTAFDMKAFSAKYPGLFAYARVILTSVDLFDAPRLVYQFNGETGPAPRMLFGRGESPAVATIDKVDAWDDSDRITDWVGDYSFETTGNGPYLVSTMIGRETTGVITTRHILGWVRMEAARLVAERFEAFDVPLGQARLPIHLKTTAIPRNPTTPSPSVSPQGNPQIDPERSRSVSAEPVKSSPPLQQSAPKNAPSNERRLTASEEQVSSTPWSTIVVLIVVVLGLLWWLLKRRS